jgi:hypothetical protein
MKSKFAAVFGLMLAALPAGAATAGEDFTPCDDARAAPQLAGSLCARFEAPLERGTPSGEKISLFLRQFPATTSSLGQVWLITGESGASLYSMIGTMRLAFPGYDLIVPDRRGSGGSSTKGGAASTSAINAAYDLQAEIDRYARGGATLLYGTSRGSDLVLKTLKLVRPRRVEAVILDSPPRLDGQTAPLTALSPGTAQGLRQAPREPGQTDEPGLDTTLPRTLILQGDPDVAPPQDIEPKSPVTTYIIDGAPSFLMLTVPECAAPLVRDFVQGNSDGDAPCAGRLSIRF